MYYFLHIPKTAGSTINYIFSREYGLGKLHLNCHWTTFYDHRHKLQRAVEASQEIKLVHGHFFFGIHNSVPSPRKSNSGYFTLLREPSSRVISGYKHNLRDKYSPFYQAANQLSFEEYLFQEKLWENDNGQVRRLIEEGHQIPFGQVNDTHLAIAKQNLLESFIAVGFTEQFDASILSFRDELRWSRNPYYWKQNSAKRPIAQKLTARTRSLVSELNQYDNALYNWALKRFSLTYTEQDVISFGRENYLYNYAILPKKIFAKMRFIVRKRFIQRK